jgi:hypothetical protein
MEDNIIQATNVDVGILMDLPKITENQVKIFTNLGNIIKEIEKEIESILNTNGQLSFYVDAQVILDYLTDITNRDDDPNTIPQRVINSSLVPIDWIENTPVVNGLPIWERLDCEPLEYYRLYKLYRDQKTVGITTENDNVIHQRSFDNLEKSTNIKRQALYALSMVYHWQIRVKLFDQFRENIIEKEKERLIKLMESRHSVAARDVFDKCMTYFKNLDEGQMKTISPKAMLSWLEMAVKLDRLSLGIPADKPMTKDETERIGKIINITKTDNKTLNITANSKDKDSYLQEMLDILEIAGATPKSIKSKSDVLNELEVEQPVEHEIEDVEVVEIDGSNSQ